MRPIQLIWLKDPNDQEAKERIKQSLITFINSELGKKFKEILHQQMKTTEAGEIKPSYYDTPNWEFRQAHLNGYKQHLIQMLDLFDIAE